MIAFFATFHAVIFKSKLTKDKLCLKIVLRFIFGLINLFYIFIHFAGGVVSLEQILLSIFMGFVVFFTMFFIFEAKVNNAKQFYIIVHFRFFYYLLLNIILVAFLILFYKFIVAAEATAYYSQHVVDQIDRIEDAVYSIRTMEFFSLNGANFCNAICFLLNIFAIIGLKFELYGTYSSNFDIWKKGNFENQEGQTGLTYSIYSDHQFIKGTQWNHTSTIKKIIRLFLLIILIVIGFIPAFIIELIARRNETDKGATVENNPGYFESLLRYVFFIGFPYFYISFGMFFFFKFVSKKLGLTNITMNSSSY